MFESLISAWGLLLIVGLPLLLSLVVPVPGARSLVVRLAPWAALPALVFSVAAPVDVSASVSWLLLDLHLGMDQLARVFLFFTSWLWLLAGLYGLHYVTGEANRHRFFAFYLLTMAGNLGVVLSQDMLSFLTFFAVMSVASYGLIIHRLNVEAIQAAKIYIVLVIVGEVLLFSGAALVAGAAQSYALVDVTHALAQMPERDWIILLLFLGFGIKAGALPVHVWLPLAHPAAPTPASAILSGAMIKAGLLGWLRFFPVGQVDMTGWGWWCVVAGLFAAFYGVAVGLLQRNPKTILAYSSISQMGLMTLMLGMAMMAPQVWPFSLAAISIYALHHALAKGSLFLSVGVSLETVTAVWPRRLFVAGIVFPALALAGAPWTSGAIAKLALKDALGIDPPFSIDAMLWLISAASVGTALLMARFIYTIWPTTHRPDTTLRPGLWVPWALLVVSSALVPWVIAWPDFREAARHALGLGVQWGTLWPVLVAAIIAIAVLRRGAPLPYVSTWQVPAGDIVAPVLWVWGYLQRATLWKVEATAALWSRASQGVRQLYDFLEDRASLLAAVEDRLANWHVGGYLLLLIGGLFLIVLTWTFVFASQVGS